jgi:hypothetical protein
MLPTQRGESLGQVCCDRNLFSHHYVGQIIFSARKISYAGGISKLSLCGVPGWGISEARGIIESATT